VKRYTRKTGRKATGEKEILENFEHDPAAKECFIEFGNNPAEFSAPWLKAFNTDLLVIGGNVIGAYGIWGKIFEKSLQNHGVQI